ncbi:MAG: heavy-metal-associated domain-containing protein [Lachnospiraceae bacterium]|nr:heavy-metal-associated domain-containing protein [Lachnospiraceae bacterium]MBR4144979.1 heavy-metal-associated domain-containing protein [Lachnospiraceae bacterium]MBR4781020.1 heavy-metal-associated domain-containing protein [Lachnospiraceae bacterium]
MVKHITLKIDGMMCGMCESHVNDAIRSALNVRKLKTSHATGISEFYTDDVVSDERLRAIIEKTGYRLLNVEREYIS